MIALVTSNREVMQVCERYDHSYECVWEHNVETERDKYTFSLHFGIQQIVLNLHSAPEKRIALALRPTQNRIRSW